MNKAISTLLKIVLFLGIGVTILGLLYNSLNKKYQEDCQLRGIASEDCSLVDKVISDFQSASIFWLGMIVVCFMLSNVSRAMRWRQMTTSLGYHTRLPNGFWTIMLGYFANLGLPRLGEIVRPATFAKYERIPLEKVVGTVALGRIIDLICFASVFLLALLLQFDTLWGYLSEQASIRHLLASPLVIGGLVAGLLALAIFYFRWDQIKSSKLAQRLLRVLHGFLDGLRSISKIRNLGVFVFHSIVIWLLYYLMTVLCFQAFAPTAHLGPLAGLLVFVFGSIGMIIPAPGGMGSYHALVVAALTIYGVGQDDAFSFAMIIFFTINIFGNVLFGLLALVLLPGLNASYIPHRP